jgi:hypothetical protein
MSHSRLHVAYASLEFNAVFGFNTNFAAVTPISNTGQPVTSAINANLATVAYLLSFFVQVLKIVI